MAENTKPTKPTKPTICCRVGWHRWSKWDIANVVISGKDAVAQARHCEDCNLTEMRVLRG